jgi:uncharacterized integral membrane protein
MSSEQKETKQVYKSKRVKVMLAILVLLMILDGFAPRHHAHFFWDSIPGFWAVFGFIACAILVFFSKGIGHAFLMKREDYYDD